MAVIENSVLVKISSTEIGTDGKFSIPNSVTSIGNNAFILCTRQKNR